MKRISIAFLSGLLFTYVILTANQASPQKALAAFQFTNQVWDAAPPLEIPDLAEIIGQAATDAEALAAVRAYYEANAEALSVIFDEPDAQRTKALFGMYIIHTAVPYNVVSWDWENDDFLDFAHAPTAHCGVYARAQSQLYTEFGLTWRIVLVDGGWHGLIEVMIGDEYEIFDSTSNVWISQPVESLIRGDQRQYREFWTPVSDPNESDVYRDHIVSSNGYYNVLELRAGITLWGLAVFPSRYEIIDSSH